MVVQCSKLFFQKVPSEFLRQDSQSSNSFGKIQNVGETELSEEKTYCFIGERFHISFSYIYIYIHIIYIYTINLSHEKYV